MEIAKILNYLLEKYRRGWVSQPVFPSIPPARICIKITGRGNLAPTILHLPTTNGRGNLAPTLFHHPIFTKENIHNILSTSSVTFSN